MMRRGLRRRAAPASPLYQRGLAANKDWAQAFASEAGYRPLRDAFDALKGLEDLYGFQFPAAAGISPGFNALDGD